MDVFTVIHCLAREYTGTLSKPIESGTATRMSP